MTAIIVSQHPWLALLILGGMALIVLFIGWVLFKIGVDADDYDAAHPPQRYLDSLKKKDGDDDQTGIGA
jgi:hypothetical protein